MKIPVTVIVDLAPAQGFVKTEGEMRSAARQMVLNAMEYAYDNGLLSHDADDSTEVEPFTEDSVTAANKVVEVLAEPRINRTGTADDPNPWEWMFYARNARATGAYNYGCGRSSSEAKAKLDAAQFMLNAIKNQQLRDEQIVLVDR